MQEILFVQYPACSTCQKAKKWLTEHGIAPTVRHIVDEAPTEAELTEWINRSGLPVSKLFNTSGILYREMAIKDQLTTLGRQEQIALLATHGKLIKRPLLVSHDFVLVGFKPEAWAEALGIK